MVSTLCTQLPVNIPEPKQAQERSQIYGLCQVRYSHTSAPALHSVHYTLLKHTPPHHTSPKQLSILTRKAPSTSQSTFSNLKIIMKRQGPLPTKKELALHIN